MAEQKVDEFTADFEAGVRKITDIARRNPKCCLCFYRSDQGGRHFPPALETTTTEWLSWSQEQREDFMRKLFDMGISVQ